MKKIFQNDSMFLMPYLVSLYIVIEYQYIRGGLALSICRLVSYRQAIVSLCLPYKQEGCILCSMFTYVRQSSSSHGRSHGKDKNTETTECDTQFLLQFLLASVVPGF